MKYANLTVSFIIQYDRIYTVKIRKINGHKNKTCLFLFGNIIQFEIIDSFYSTLFSLIRRLEAFQSIVIYGPHRIQFTV